MATELLELNVYGNERPANELSRKEWEHVVRQRAFSGSPTVPTKEFRIPPPNNYRFLDLFTYGRGIYSNLANEITFFNVELLKSVKAYAAGTYFDLVQVNFSEGTIEFVCIELHRLKLKLEAVLS